MSLPVLLLLRGQLGDLRQPAIDARLARGGGGLHILWQLHVRTVFMPKELGFKQNAGRLELW